MSWSESEQSRGCAPPAENAERSDRNDGTAGGKTRKPRGIRIPRGFGSLSGE